MIKFIFNHILKTVLILPLDVTNQAEPINATLSISPSFISFSYNSSLMVYTLMNYGGVSVKYKWKPYSYQRWDYHPQVFHCFTGTRMLNLTHLHCKTSNLLTNVCVLSFKAVSKSYGEWLSPLSSDLRLKLFTNRWVSGSFSRRGGSVVCDKWQPRLMRMSDSSVPWLNFQRCPFAAGSYNITWGFVQWDSCLFVKFVSLKQ